MLKVFRIGVELSAVNGVSPVLRVLARDLLGMGKQADALVGKWSRLRVAAIGAGVAMAGVGILRGMVKLVDLSDKLYRSELRLQQMGMSKGGVRAVTGAALRAQMRYPTVTASSSEDVAQKLYTTFGTSKRVQAALPATVRAEAVLENMGIGGPASLGRLVKAIEISGAAFKTVNGKEQFSVGRFKRALDLFLRAQDVAGPLLTSAQIYQATKMAGPAAGLEGIRAYVATMAELAQQMGPRGGRGMAQIYKGFNGGMMGRTYLENLQRLGIVKPGGIQWFQGSSQGNIKPGALLGQKTFDSGHLFQWVEKILVPDLRKHGMTTLKQQLAAVYQMFGSVTAQAVIANMIQNAPAYTRTAEMIHGAPGAQRQYDIQMKSWTASMTAFRHEFTSFLEVAGLPLIRTASAGLHDLTGVIVRMEKWAIANPQKMALIDKGIVLLGAALITLGSGTVLLALASLVSPTTGLIALAGGITALGASVKSIPPWLIHAVQGAAAGATAAKFIPGVGPVAGAVAGGVGGALWGLNPLGLNNITPAQLAHNMLHTDMRHPASMGGGVPAPHQSLLGSLKSLRAPAVPSAPSHGGASGAPVPVVVMNGRDIADGVTKHQAKGLQRNPSGPTGHNLRQGYLQPAYPAPGL